MDTNVLNDECTWLDWLGVRLKTSLSTALHHVTVKTLLYCSFLWSNCEKYIASMPPCVELQQLQLEMPVNTSLDLWLILVIKYVCLQK